MKEHKKVVRKIIKVGDLKNAPWNPPRRILPEFTRDIEDSMELIGMLHPLTVTPFNMVIDGHRRLAVAKRLGWPDVECNVVETSPEEIYASVNSTPRRMSGNDALGVWLSSPQAVTLRMDKQFRVMQEVIGKELVTKIYKSGCSMRVYRTAVSIAKYCDDMTDETVKKIVSWLLEFAVIGQVMKALEAGVDPKKIMKAVSNNKPITLRLDVA